MTIKIEINKNSEEFELDFFEGFCTIPIVIDRKMILGGFIIGLNFLDKTFEQLPIELKNILDEKKTRFLYLKKMVLNITDITAYSIILGETKEKKKKIEEIFNDFNKNIKIHEILCFCNFPNENIEIYFQNKGKIYLEFDIKDIFFIENNNYELFYKIQKEEIEKIQLINKNSSVPNFI